MTSLKNISPLIFCVCHAIGCGSTNDGADSARIAEQAPSRAEGPTGQVNPSQWFLLATLSNHFVSTVNGGVYASTGFTKFHFCPVNSQTNNFSDGVGIQSEYGNYLSAVMTGGNGKHTGQVTTTSGFGLQEVFFLADPNAGSDTVAFAAENDPNGYPIYLQAAGGGGHGIRAVTPGTYNLKPSTWETFQFDYNVAFPNGVTPPKCRAF